MKTKCKTNVFPLSSYEGPGRFRAVTKLGQWQRFCVPARCVNEWTHRQTHIHTGFTTHPRRPSDWCSPASHLWRASSGTCPAGPTLHGWSLQLYPWGSPIPKRPRTVQVTQANCCQCAEEAETAAPRKWRGAGCVDRSICVRGSTRLTVSAELASALLIHSQKQTHTELVIIYCKDASHELWYSTTWGCFSDLVVRTSRQVINTIDSSQTKQWPWCGPSETWPWGGRGENADNCDWITGNK